MNGILALCHFCETHGPSVMFLTQTFHDNAEPLDVFENGRILPTRKRKPYYGNPEYAQRTVPNTPSTSSAPTSPKASESCEACRFKPYGYPDLVCNDHEAGVSYISSQHPYHPEVFSVVRQACVRSLSCEVCPGREGPIFFGDDSRGHVISHTFFLKDSQARGFHRWYSVIVIMMDKIYLLNSWPFLVTHIKKVIDELQAKANKVYLY
ncbi:Folliculin [Nymphon striatum]|nr:Folliculin [Nymphon striatum]